MRAALDVTGNKLRQEQRDLVIATATIAGAEFEFIRNYWVASGSFRGRDYKSVCCVFKHNAAADWLDEFNIPYAVPA